MKEMLKVLTFLLLLTSSLSFAIWVQPHVHAVPLEYCGPIPVQAGHHAP